MKAHILLTDRYGNDVVVRKDMILEVFTGKEGNSCVVIDVHNLNTGDKQYLWVEQDVEWIYERLEDRE